MLLRIMRSGIIYLLLIAGAIVFSFPFVWMTTTSMKVDRELFQTNHVLPIKPTPCLQSPYVDENFYPRPENVRAKDIVAAIKELIPASGFTAPADVANQDAVADTIARGLYTKLTSRINRDVWDGPLPELQLVLKKEVTQSAVTGVFNAAYRRLMLGQIVVRDKRTLEEEKLGGESEFSTRFENFTPDVASFTDNMIGNKAYATVNYNFSKSDHITLERTFDLGFDVSDLERLQLFIQPDDTWHELTITVEKGGKKYLVERPEVLANSNPQTITYQERGPDDNSLRIKTWRLLQEVPNTTSPITGPRQLRLTLELRQVSPAQAWANKMKINYTRVLDEIPFWRYVSTSIFLVIMNIILAVLVSSLVAYAFARLNWPGRELAFMVMLATMMIPGQVTMIPHFLIWKSLGVYNTLTPLWLGSAFGSAFFIFLMRQTMKGIPRDLEDAARIDGCGFLRIYWNIILPLVKPSLAAIAIFTFMGTWNDFMGPLIYLSDQRLYSLAFGLYAYFIQLNQASFNLTMAAALLMTLPVIIIFFFAQKYFIQGIASTGMKG